MVQIFKFILFSLLLLALEIQSFCIYNNFSDGTSFEVTQRIKWVSSGRTFKKNIESGSSECCPFTSRDCSERQIDDDPVFFYVFFRWPRYNSERHVVECVAGGALTFLGDEKHHHAQCTNKWGITYDTAIIPDAKRS